MAKIKFKTKEKRDKAINMLSKNGFTALSEQKNNDSLDINFKTKGAAKSALSEIKESLEQKDIMNKAHEMMAGAAKEDTSWQAWLAEKYPDMSDEDKKKILKFATDDNNAIKKREKSESKKVNHTKRIENLKKISESFEGYVTEDKDLILVADQLHNNESASDAELIKHLSKETRFEASAIKKLVSKERGNFLGPKFMKNSQNDDFKVIGKYLGK